MSETVDRRVPPMVERVAKRIHRQDWVGRADMNDLSDWELLPASWKTHYFILADTAIQAMREEEATS